MRWGDTLDAIVVGWRASVVRGEEPGCFCDIAGVSIVVAGGPHSLSRQLSGLKKCVPYLPAVIVKVYSTGSSPMVKGGQMLYS